MQVRFCGGLGQEGFELVLRGLGREAVGRGGVLHGRVDCAGGGHGEGFVGFWSRVEGVCFVLCCCMECWFQTRKVQVQCWGNFGRRGALQRIAGRSFVLPFWDRKSANLRLHGQLGGGTYAYWTG